MSNVLQAVDFLKLSQSSVEKLKNRNCCKLSFRMLTFEAAEEVSWRVFSLDLNPSPWFLLMLFCLCRVRVLLLPQTRCGFQREEETWGEITKAAGEPELFFSSWHYLWNEKCVNILQAVQSPQTLDNHIIVLVLKCKACHSRVIFSIELYIAVLHLSPFSHSNSEELVITGKLGDVQAVQTRLRQMTWECIWGYFSSPVWNENVTNSLGSMFTG